METQVESTTLDGVITVEPRAFIPQAPLVLEGGSPAQKLTSRKRAELLKIINRTRAGKNHFTVEINYDKQTNSVPRIAGEDFQIPTGVSTKTHVGLVVNARRSKRGHVFITVLDSCRQSQGARGFTSMRLEGIKSLRIVTERDGPVPPKS